MNDFQFSGDGYKEFDAGGFEMKIHKKPRIYIPSTVSALMFAILPHMQDPNNEYLIYLKGRWDPDTCSVVVDTDEWFMPGQDATPSHVRALEDPPDASWNVAIHRHPSGCRSFSGTDDRDINQNFLASMIYIPPGEFPDAIINIPLTDDKMSRLQVRSEVYLTYENGQQIASIVAEKHRSRPRAVAPPPVSRGIVGREIPGGVSALGGAGALGALGRAAHQQPRFGTALRPLAQLGQGRRITEGVPEELIPEPSYGDGYGYGPMDPDDSEAEQIVGEMQRDAEQELGGHRVHRWPPEES